MLGGELPCAIVLTKIASCYLSGLNSDLIVGPMALHFEATGMHMELAALAAAAFPFSRFIGACAVAFFSTPLVTIALSTIGIGGFVLVWMMPSSGAAFVACGLCVGASEQLAYMQKTTGLAGESIEMQKRLQAIQWMSYVAGLASATLISGIIFERISFAALIHIGLWVQVAITLLSIAPTPRGQPTQYLQPGTVPWLGRARHNLAAALRASAHNSTHKSKQSRSASTWAVSPKARSPLPDPSLSSAGT